MRRELDVGCSAVARIGGVRLTNPRKRGVREGDHKRAERDGGSCGRSSQGKTQVEEFALSRAARYPTAVSFSTANFPEPRTQQTARPASTPIAAMIRSGARLLGLLTLAALLSHAPAQAAGRLTAQQTFELGERFAKRGATPKALEQYNRVRTYFRDDPYALKAELAIAELHSKKSEWDAARLAYEDFLKAHPRYAELDFVVFRLGMTLYQKAPVVAAKDQTWTRQAINTWTGFASRFPNSKHGVEAEKFLTKARNRMGHKEILISRFYDRREAGLAVEGRSTRFLEQYPGSPDRPEALTLLAVAYARQDKDPTPVIEKLKLEDPKRVSIAQREVSTAAARHVRQVARALAKAERQIKH